MVGLLYLLARDHIPAGVLERAVVQVEGFKDRKVELPQGHLGAYAEEIVERLRKGDT